MCVGGGAEELRDVGSERDDNSPTRETTRYSRQLLRSIAMG